MDGTDACIVGPARDPAKSSRENLRTIPYEVFDQTAYARYDGEFGRAEAGVTIRVLRLAPTEVISMHIPDMLLDPKVAAVTALVGAGGLFYSLRKLERQLGERTTVLMGTMSAFVFAAQMVNFPVGTAVSGHLLGGVLASVLLGPWAGAVVIATVLLVQCFLFADGGVTALGANFINMGLVGAVGGYAIYAPIRRALGGQKGVLIAAMAAAWFSVILASGAFAIELAASGHWSGFLPILSWMVLVHAAIGVGEALVTGMVVRFLVVRRPDLFDLADGPTTESRSTGGHWGQTVVGGLAIAVAVAVFLGPFAYDKPDGLEFVGEKLGFLRNDAPPSPFPAPIPDYELKLPGVEHVKLATAAAGLVGTLVVFGVAWGMARVLPHRQNEEATSHAA
jgi:cobalt/nickel transport system permease protein